MTFSHFCNTNHYITKFILIKISHSEKQKFCHQINTCAVMNEDWDNWSKDRHLYMFTGVTYRPGNHIGLCQSVMNTWFHCGSFITIEGQLYNVSFYSECMFEKILMKSFCFVSFTACCGVGNLQSLICISKHQNTKHSFKHLLLICQTLLIL